MNIVHVNDVRAAEDAREMGFEPIECSIGNESVVGSLNMDHHGSLSHLEGVAVRAYRDHRGARLNDPRFVVTGAADADACFAIAALAGLPDGLMPLADLVNRVDCDPIAVDLTREEHGAVLLAWNQMSSGPQDALAFYAGVDRWRVLTSKRRPEALIRAALEGERSRVATVKSETKILAAWQFVRVQRQIGADVVPLRSVTQAVLVQSPAWGFDVWYRELADCVLALTPEGNVTVGCPSREVAERLFGPGGLKNAFPRLEPAGWGGREAIGGSPRGLKLTVEQACAALEAIGGMIRASS